MKLKDNIFITPPKWPFYYGYFILFCSIIGVTLSAPGQTIGVMPFIDYYIGELDINRFQISVCYTIGTVISAVIINRTGNLLDRVGSRRIVFVSCLSVGLILVCLSQVDHFAAAIEKIFGGGKIIVFNLVIITLGFVLLRFFAVWGLGVASRTMLMRWFHDKRGRVNSVLYLATTVSFAAIPRLFEWLIQVLGWRGALISVGAAIGLIFSIFALIFFRNSPEENGLNPDGVSLQNRKNESTIEVEESWELSQAQQTYSFWIFNIGLAMFGLVSTAFTFHSISIFEIAGRSRSEAISVFLPASLIAVGINLAAGWLCDLRYFKNKMKYFMIAQLVGLQILCFGLITLNRGSGIIYIIIGYGITRGLLGTLVSVTWPRYFGKKHLGAITSFGMSIVVFSGAIGPLIFGFSYNNSGNYNNAIIICWIALAVLLILSIKADKPRMTDQKKSLEQ